MRPPPIAATLAATLGKLSHDTREQLATEKLTFETVKQACTAAACLGLLSASIPLGPANLGNTKAARALQAALVGFTFEWVESIERDGQKVWELRLGWPLAAPLPK